LDPAFQRALVYAKRSITLRPWLYFNTQQSTTRSITSFQNYLATNLPMLSKRRLSVDEQQTPLLSPAPKRVRVSFDYCSDVGKEDTPTGNKRVLQDLEEHLEPEILYLAPNKHIEEEESLLKSDKHLDSDKNSREDSPVQEKSFLPTQDRVSEGERPPQESHNHIEREERATEWDSYNEEEGPSINSENYDEEESRLIGAAASIPVPLTYANIAKLNRANMSASTDTWGRQRGDGSESPSKRSKNAIDDATRLKKFNIFPAAITPQQPAPIVALVRRILTSPRTQQSPNAKRVVTCSPLAEQMTERDGIRLLSPLLLFKSAWEDSGEPLIHVTEDTNLFRDRLPPQIHGLAKARITLEQPRPDSMVGYLKNSHAEALGLDVPFSVVEELAMDEFKVSQEVHFPFLTCQWKSQRGSGSITDAQLQAARDGAAIVNSMHQLSDAATRAGLDPLDAENKCHFSLACDMSTAALFVHCRVGDAEESPSYHMWRIAHALLSNEESMSALRLALRNILDWATTTRLNSMRAATAVLVTAMNKPRQRSVKNGSAQASSAGNFPGMIPLTPVSDSTSDMLPPKKRPRISNEEEN
jgi:hypothetical protein